MKGCESLELKKEIKKSLENLFTVDNLRVRNGFLVRTASEKYLRWPRRDYTNTHPRRGVYVCYETSYTHSHTLQTQNKNIQKYKYTKIQIYKNTNMHTNIRKYKNFAPAQLYGLEQIA